jgi:hypothetical protein
MMSCGICAIDSALVRLIIRSLPAIDRDVYPFAVYG